MDIAVIGTGYVGLVTGTCLATMGHRVVCMDRDRSKINRLKAGDLPIHEEGLKELISSGVAEGRLSFSDNLAEALSGSEAVFLAIGTPSAADGSSDLSMIYAAAEQIGSVMRAPLIIIQKSTCPVGTSQEVQRRVATALAARGVEIPFSVAVNPEFLREGSAVRDFMHPDRVVIGADTEEVGQRVTSLYEKLVAQERILMMDRPSAEMTKYAANAFLAMKISFINEVANLCEHVGADIEFVRHGIGLDNRIGPAFLAAGLGYGGSCFPKDVKALVQIGIDSGFELQILQAVETVNRQQRERQVEKIVRRFNGSLTGKRVAVWGLAFKPGTDDMREAPSVDIVNTLVSLGATVVVHDPVAMERAAEVLPEHVTFAKDALTCVDGADVLVLVTEWDEYRKQDLNEVGSRMASRLLFDFRNGLNPAVAAQANFEYCGVGRATQREMLAVR